MCKLPKSSGSKRNHSTEKSNIESTATVWLFFCSNYIMLSKITWWLKLHIHQIQEMWALGTKLMNLISHFTKISSDTSPPVQTTTFVVSKCNLNSWFNVLFISSKAAPVWYVLCHFWLKAETLLILSPLIHWKYYY